MRLIVHFQEVKFFFNKGLKESNMLQKSLFSNYFYKKRIKVLGQRFLKLF